MNDTADAVHYTAITQPTLMYTGSTVQLAYTSPQLATLDLRPATHTRSNTTSHFSSRDG